MCIRASSLKSTSVSGKRLSSIEDARVTTPKTEEWD